MERQARRGRSMICDQTLTSLPRPKNHLVVLTGLHHPCAGAEPQLSAWLSAEFVTLQPPTLNALLPKLSAT